MSRNIAQRHKILFPVGSGLCEKHRHAEGDGWKAIPDESEGEDDATHSEEIEFIPPSVGTVDGSKEELNAFLSSAVEIEKASPMKFQVKSPVNELATSTVRYLGRKYKQYKDEFKKMLCEKLAPGQGDELAKMLSDSDHSEEDDDEVPIDDFLLALVEAYKMCLSEKSRIAILSMVPKEKYSKSVIMKSFNCSKYQVDKARKLREEYGPAGTVPETEVCRQKLDQNKADHFLDYLFTSGALQDVAYGTTLKYDSGDKQTVPHAVLTALKSHVIQDYQSYCSDVDYVPLSKSSLWNILGAIRPRQRRALGGLDNTTADGLEAIDDLTKILERGDLGIDDVKESTHRLEEGKRYIKMGFKMHCAVDSNCATHCCAFALSNPSDDDFRKECDHNHEMSCPECCNLIETLDIIQENCDKR